MYNQRMHVQLTCAMNSSTVDSLGRCLGGKANQFGIWPRMCISQYHAGLYSKVHTGPRKTFTHYETRVIIIDFYFNVFYTYFQLFSLQV
jgi:hypothetical protein